MNTKPDYDKLYELAESQGGYFAANQAKDIGFSYERLSNNVNSGRFIRAAHGIYRLAHFPNSPYEDLFIAWLRTGPDSAISHESALAIYDFSDALPFEVHVTVPREASRRRYDIRQHTNELHEDEITFRAGLAVTTVARTIADVAASGLAEELVIQAIEEALERGMVSENELKRYVDIRGGRLRKILSAFLDTRGSG